MDFEMINGGENVQEVAAPAETITPENGGEGARGQEVADPASDDSGSDEMLGGNGGSSSAEDGGRAEPAGEGGREGAQDPDTNAQFAAARRKAERDKTMELERMRADYARQQDMLIANMGLTHPETGKPVQNRAEYDSMQSYMRKQTELSLARKAGMTEEEWQRHIESSPAVREAREVQRRAEAAEQAARAEQIRQQLREDLAEITRMDGRVKSFDDLRAAENWPEIEGRMKRGYSLIDAYRLVNMDTIAERRAAAAKQQAMNAATQKQHMQRTEQRGSGGVVVPREIMAQYKRLNPSATDAEIAAHYAKYAKK